MKLSIVVPVYNMAGNEKLNYCMDSLLRQTITDYEIIAVDDASTDDSLSILREYEKNYPEKVKVIAHTQNKRQGGARNTGMKAATGEWIGFIDSDDWIHPTMYETLIARGEETDADVVGCDYNLVNQHTMEVGKIVQNNTKEQAGTLDKEKHKLWILRPGSMVIKVYKREMLMENHLTFPEGILYEDNCASPLWMLYCKHFEKVDEPFYYYYQYETSTVHTVSEERCQYRMQAMNLFLEECKKRNILQEYFAEIEYRYSELFLKNTLFSIMQSGQSVRHSFLRALQQGMKENFPDFQSNAYYLNKTDAEEQKLIRMFMKSISAFVCYYRMLYFYRKLRYGNRNK